MHYGRHLFISERGNTVTTLVVRPDIGRQRRMSILGFGPEFDTDL